MSTMKKSIAILLLFGSFLSYGQQVKKDSILKSITEYREIVFLDASLFINSSLSPEERIKAIQNHFTIYDEGQKNEFKKIVLSGAERPEIRAMGLNKIYDEVIKDKKLYDQVIMWLSEPQTPKVLRNETLNLVGNLSFSYLPGIIDAYYTMLNDPEITYRQFAFNKLVSNGDVRAQKMLIDGLNDRNAALIDPLTSMSILSVSPKKDYYPAVYKYVLDAGKEEERVMAIQIIGGYKEAKGTLLSIFQSQREKSIFRESALLSFYSSNKKETVGYLPRLLRDESASSNLKILAIQMAINERKAASYRQKVKKADELDIIIKNLADGKQTDDKSLMSVANKYLLMVRPPF
jgi:hypothetical protein